jgi:capsular polysaccharide transport system ATP-binding protein
MISGESVTKFYHTRSGDRYILDNQDFQIKRGDNIGILGPNGAGKSTFVRLLAGTEYPSSGVIRREMSVSWPIGFAGAFQLGLTGADNVRFVSRVYGQDSKKVLAFVQEFAELGRYIDMPLKTYSSGMQARLAFGVSLAVNFDCYLVDEVTAVGDSRFQERCREALLARRETGALIMVSHDGNTLRQYCQRGWILRDGQIIDCGDIEAAIAKHEEHIWAR